MEPGPVRKGLWAFALAGGVQRALQHAQTIYTMIFLASGGVQTVPLRNSFCIYKALWACKIFQNFWSVRNFPCFSSSAFLLHNNVLLTFKILLHDCKIHVRFQSTEFQWCKLIHQNQREAREGRRATIIVQMKKRKLELFNKGSTEPCSLPTGGRYRERERYGEYEDQKEEENNFWPSPNCPSYCRLGAEKPIHACPQDMLFHGQCLICSQTNTHKHPNFP